MEWIDVKIKLPEKNTPVLVVDDEDDIWIMEYHDTYGWQCPQEGWGMRVTHWMCLPKKPNRVK